MTYYHLYLSERVNDMAEQNINEQEQANQIDNTEQSQQVVKVVQEKKPGVFKRARQKGRDDIKRATQIEDGSVIKAVIDLWRMLFPKK